MRPDDIAVSRQGNLVVINHDKFEIKFNLAKGTWDYIDERGDTVIRNGCAEVTLGDGSVIKTENAGIREFVTQPTTDVLGECHQIRFSCEVTKKGIRINTYLNCYADQPAIHLKIGVENLKTDPLQLESLTVLGVSANRGAVLLGKTPADCHLFINMPPISPGVSKKLYDGFLLSETDTMHPSHDGVLHDTESGKALVFGFLTTEKWWPRIQVGCQANGKRNSQSNNKKRAGVNTWKLYHQCEQECTAGTEIVSETAYINFTGGAKAAYEHYTARLAAQHRTLNTQASYAPLTAWTFSGTSEPLEADTVLTQIDAIAEHPLFQPNYPGGINYIQVDTVSGLQNIQETETVVKKVQETGFKVGVRINPFCVALDSELVQNYPDRCIQKQNNDKNGKGRSRRRTDRNGYEPATIHLPDTGNEVALLDVSHPEVQGQIREQIKHIVCNYGSSFINVDFIGYTTGLTKTSHDLRWHDDNLTALQLYRSAVELLTETVDEACLQDSSEKEKVLLTGYNAVASVSLGGIDINAPLLNSPFPTAEASNRASDQWHHQRGIKHRLTRYAAHLREHNVLWHHLFGEISVDEPRPVNEVIVELTAAALSGGAVFCADRIEAFTPARAAAFAKILPLGGEPATPIDLYEDPFPRIWYLPVSTPHETWHLAAIFNWNDYEDDVYFKLDALESAESNDFLVHDFWMRQYLGKVSQNVNLLNIPPRSAKLFCFREEQDVPQLLSTDMHYTQGGADILSAGWDHHSQSFLLVCKPLRQAEGTCFIHVPEGYLPISVATYGSDYQYTWDRPIYQLKFARTQPGQLVHTSIHFAKTSGGNA